MGLESFFTFFLDQFVLASKSNIWLSAGSPFFQSKLKSMILRYQFLLLIQFLESTDIIINHILIYLQTYDLKTRSSTIFNGLFKNGSCLYVRGEAPNYYNMNKQISLPIQVSICWHSNCLFIKNKKLDLFIIYSIYP